MLAWWLRSVRRIISWSNSEQVVSDWLHAASITICRQIWWWGTVLRITMSCRLSLRLAASHITIRCPSNQKQIQLNKALFCFHFVWNFYNPTGHLGNKKWKTFTCMSWLCWLVDGGESGEFISWRRSVRLVAASVTTCRLIWWWVSCRRITFSCRLSVQLGACHIITKCHLNQQKI